MKKLFIFIIAFLCSAASFINLDQCPGGDYKARGTCEAQLSNQPVTNITTSGADVNLNVVADTSGILYGYVTTSTSAPSDTALINCINGAPGFLLTGVDTHAYGFLSDEAISTGGDCGPCWGVRAHSSGFWRLSFEPFNQPNAQFDLSSYQNDRGQWVRFIVHYIEGSNQEFRLWMNPTSSTDAPTISFCASGCDHGLIDTTSDEWVHRPYFQLGLYDTHCRSNVCPTLVADYDDIRWADGSDLTNAEGFAAVDPARH